MKIILNKIMHDLGASIYHSFFRILGYIIVFLVIGLAASRCAKAMTINENLRTINESTLNTLKNIYERSDYNYYLISSNYIKSGYSNYTDYYLCLTNERFDVSDASNTIATCSELYKYNTYNDYSFVKVNDPELKIVNSFYYVKSKKKDLFFAILMSILVGLFIFVFLYIVCKIFGL